MITGNKTNRKKPIAQIPHPHFAGVMPSDAGIEFVANRETKETLWYQHGNVHYWRDLPQFALDLITKRYLETPKAVSFLSAFLPDFNQQLEHFAWYMWGSLDATPDIDANGVLSDSENFREKENCPSLLWNTKNINIGSHILTERQVFIIDMIYQGHPDKMIADALHITVSTYDSHKTKLFKAVGVTTRTELIIKAIKWKVIEL